MLVKKRKPALSMQHFSTGSVTLSLDRSGNPVLFQRFNCHINDGNLFYRYTSFPFF